MSADELLFTAGMERGTVPGQGLAGLPDRAREYVAAWFASIDRGCGHDPGGVKLTAMPVLSALCPECADRVGLLDRAMKCGRCGIPVDTGRGDYAAVFAATEHVIVFAAMCRGCVEMKEG